MTDYHELIGHFQGKFSDPTGSPVPLPQSLKTISYLDTTQTISTQAKCAHALVLAHTQTGPICLLNKDQDSDAYNLPGGHSIKYESPIQTFIRELYEETCLIIKPQFIAYLGILYFGSSLCPLFMVDIADCELDKSIQPDSQLTFVPLSTLIQQVPTQIGLHIHNSITLNKTS